MLGVAVDPALLTHLFTREYESQNWGSDQGSCIQPEVDLSVSSRVVLSPRLSAENSTGRRVDCLGSSAVEVHRDRDLGGNPKMRHLIRPKIEG